MLYDECVVYVYCLCGFMLFGVYGFDVGVEVFGLVCGICNV